MYEFVPGLVHVIRALVLKEAPIFVDGKYDEFDVQEELDNQFYVWNC